MLTKKIIYLYNICNYLLHNDLNFSYYKTRNIIIKNCNFKYNLSNLFIKDLQTILDNCNWFQYYNNHRVATKSIFIHFSLKDNFKFLFKHFFFKNDFNFWVLHIY